MRRFFAKLALFFLPAALALGPPLAVLVGSGEVTALSPERVVSVQEDTNTLYGPAYTDCTKRYKLTAVLERAPRILVLGTSRSMQFRAPMFDQDTHFYNAGGGASRMVHFRRFLDRIPQERQPEVLVVGLDQWFFNASTEAHPEASFDAQVASCNNFLNLVQSSWTDVYSEWWDGTLPLHTIDGPPDRIGLSAVVHETGFRPDGSFLYGRIIAHRNDPGANPDFAFRETLARMAAGSHRFEHAEHVAPELVEELDRFLEAAAARGVHVVGFVPPYAPEIWSRMRESGDYEYMLEIGPLVRPRFESRGFTVFDFSNPSIAAIGDDEFVDGIHASERAHARMLGVMARGDMRLAEHVDEEALANTLAASSDPLVYASPRWR